MSPSTTAKADFGERIEMGMSLSLVRLALQPEFFGSFDLTIHKCVLEIRAVMGEYIGFSLPQNWAGVHPKRHQLLEGARYPSGSSMHALRPVHKSSIV
jgi:hypothetical protein